MELAPNLVSVGTIKVYYPLKGYGFITRASGKDLFFYRDAMSNEASIIEGNSVRFTIESTPKGPRAVNVTRVG